MEYSKYFALKVRHIVESVIDPITISHALYIFGALLLIILAVTIFMLAYVVKQKKEILPQKANKYILTSNNLAILCIGITSFLMIFSWLLNLSYAFYVLVFRVIIFIFISKLLINKLLQHISASIMQAVEERQVESAHRKGK